MILELNNISINYAGWLKNNEVLHNISLNIKHNIVFGLLGPNGAGKTTLIKGILNFLPLSSGSIKIFGQSSLDYSIKEQISYLPEYILYPPTYTIASLLDLHLSKNLWINNESNKKITNLLDKYGIHKNKNTRLKHLSKGTIQKIALAIAFEKNANLFILDEPFNGLDPEWIIRVRNTIIDLKSHGKTVLISSHILSEMEMICDEVGIINEGKLFYLGKYEKQNISTLTNLENKYNEIIKLQNLKLYG